MVTRLNVVLYTRVSRDLTGTYESTTQQEEELREVGEENGEEWEIVKVFTDPDLSASEFARKDRPGFVAMEAYLESIRPGEVDGVAIWEASRLARTMSAGIAFRDMCKRLGLLIWFGGSWYNMSNPDQRKQFTDALVDAEHESAKTSKRVKRDVKYRARDGKPHGRHVYGYSRTYTRNAKGRLVVDTVVIDEDQKAVLESIAKRVLGGDSCYSIARDLTKEQVPAPGGGAWHATNVTRLMKNPTYAGKRTLNGVVVADAIWPEIFDEVTWARLQALLGDPARKTRREGGVVHLLTGIAQCGVCGGTMGTAKQRGGYRVYTCHGVLRTTMNPTPARFCTARKIADVDPHVEAMVIEKLSHPTFLESLLGDGDRDASEISALGDQITAVQARLDGFYDSAARNKLSTAGLARIEPQLLTEISVLEARRAKIQRPTVLRSVDLMRVEQDWFSWPLRVRRSVIRELFEVRILPAGQGARRFDPSKVTVALHARFRPAS